MGPYPAENNSLTDSPPSRSFFSRFALPLRPRGRNIVDFHIRPKEPHRNYNAGDHVLGAVVLTIVKPIRITHLTVCLHGYVRVYKGPGAAANEAIINPAEVPASGASSRFRYLGNGHASLFQDEQVLSADGKLEPAKYEFNFDLVFPKKDLPSSIDFERGTISYMITATLTRPTPISPTTSCERKICLVDKLDVGFIAPPRPRTIYLEPISKRSKKKKAAPAVDKGGSTSSDTPETAASDLDSTRANENSTEGSLSVIGEDPNPESANNPRSPIHSDIRSVSGDSAVSGSTGLSRGGDTNHGGSAASHTGGTRVPPLEEKTITATIELLKGGCLPGDVMQVKISVQHVKRIKSLHGVVVTLYRQGRIDSSPPIALFKDLPPDELKRLEKEEYYPKSKTGLGGLSLSSAGSCSVFRKDLSQAFGPLIINPATLTATVTTSVRVPEDVFPTIKGVPGDMVNFKYHIEVIVDLGGKLANQLQGGNPSAPRPGGAGPVGAAPGNPYEGAPATMTTWGTSIVDTDTLRRQKGVISVAFEVIVGTDDSSRLRSKAVLPSSPTIYTQRAWGPEPYETNGNADDKGGWPIGNDEANQGPEDYGDEYIPYYPEAPQQYPYWNPTTFEPSAPSYIPPPDIPDERGLTEKERIRHAEQRLLPSQPPGASAAGASSSAMLDGDNIYDAEDDPNAGGPSRAVDQREPEPEPEAPSAPTLEDLSSAPTNTTDDKQELERQRLLAEASSPPDFPEDYEANGAPGPSSPAPTAPPATFEPSAPVLGDEEQYGSQYSYNTILGSSSQAPSAPSEPLPKYER